MRMSRLQMETGQIWELMVIRQRHPNLLPVEVRIRQIRDRHANIPVQKCETRKRQPVKQRGYTGDTYCKICNTKLSTGKSIAAKATAQKYAIKKRQPVKQQAIREILTVRSVIKNFPQERVLQQRSQHHNKDTESNCKQGWKDYKHMYTVWDNDQNGEDCQGIKDKIIKDKIYL